MVKQKPLIRKLKRMKKTIFASITRLVEAKRLRQERIERESERRERERERERDKERVEQERLKVWERT